MSSNNFANFLKFDSDNVVLRNLALVPNTTQTVDPLASYLNNPNTTSTVFSAVGACIACITLLLIASTAYMSVRVYKWKKFKYVPKRAAAQVDENVKAKAADREQQYIEDEEIRSAKKGERKSQ